VKWGPKVTRSVGDGTNALAAEAKPALTGVRDPLSSARIAVPQARLGTVSRSRLGGILSTQRPVVAAVSAPAGYGKSTLMVEWARRDLRPSAWVSFDRAVNDPVVVLGLVASALDLLHPVGSDVFDDLASPGISVLGRVVPRIAASLASAEPILLLLDDLHEVDIQECRDALNLLVDHLPTGSTVAAASRADVWLDLARRRARGELLEIGAGELAFDFAEAGQLLAAAGLELAPEVVADLRRRTEGWPAGLYLGALALRDTHDQAKALEMFAGDDRFVADYLRSEILDHAAQDARSFLIRTAVLDQLSGPLCDQLLGSSGSAGKLAALERSNLFLVPLDRRREWYRYHGLFRDLLLAELMRAEPDAVPELHRRAADWYEANGRLEEAITHAQASADSDRAAHLVGRCFQPVFFSGRLATNYRWLAGFSTAEIERHPWLAVLAGWACALTGHPIEAARWADAAERGSFVGRPPDGSASIESARALLRRSLGANGVAAMVADAELAESQEPPWSPWRASALVGLFWARQLAGDHESAEAVLRELFDMVEGFNQPSLTFALTQRSLLEMERGEWEAASTDLERARACIAELRTHEYVGSALTFAASARIGVHDQDLGAARDHLAHAMRLRPQATWAIPDFAVRLRLEMTKVLLALADPAGARSLLREIEEILRHRPELGTLVVEVDALRHRLATIPTGAVGVSTLSPAELRLVPYLQTHLTYQEIGQRLYISTNTVRTQTQSIYRKLDVSSRAGAVQQARRVGLLAG
jgi:LuxR family transcriptional regulator, maltose regulon positive regulatory protein